MHFLTTCDLILLVLLAVNRNQGSLQFIFDKKYSSKIFIIIAPFRQVSRLNIESVFFLSTVRRMASFKSFDNLFFLFHDENEFGGLKRVMGFHEENLYGRSWRDVHKLDDIVNLREILLLSSSQVLSIT